MKIYYVIVINFIVLLRYLLADLYRRSQCYFNSYISEKAFV